MACLLLLVLVGCEQPVLSADPVVANGSPGGRPVATLGPDDAIRSGSDGSNATEAPDTIDAMSRRVDVGEMKQSIDTSGRIALPIDFDSDTAMLRPETEPLIEQVASLLRGDPALRLSIEGHTDDIGDAARNRALSLQRAETVRAALIVKGIDASRLRAQGFGAERPAAGNHSDDAPAQNQRVELVRLD